MYAVVQIGAQQYKLSEGDVVKTNRLPQGKGKKITLGQVLLFADGKDVRIGQPRVADVKVSAQVVDHIRAEKKTAFKYRLRKDSATKKGHRQNLTVLRIEKITASQ